MPLLDLDDTDKAALIDLLRQTIAADRSPLSPRVTRLRAILDKLEPRPVVEILPPSKPTGEPSMALRKRRRR